MKDTLAITVALATSNQGKLDEFERILAPYDIKLYRGPKIDSPVEDGRNYFQNAAIKAINGAKKWGVICVGEDSGIEVAGLNDLPGHLSSRFHGFQTVDLQNARCEDFQTAPKGRNIDQLNNERILELLKSKSGNERICRYVACIVLADPKSNILFHSIGTVGGIVVSKPRGDKGFGFDPIVEFHQYPGRTVAELTMEEKNLVSHRGMAVNQLLMYLSKAYK